MIVIPAIDLKDHRVVRLVRGNLGDETVYSDDPVAVCRQWVDGGAGRIHLVDLNGAVKGKPIHFADIERLVGAFADIDFEIGGGLRSLRDIRRYFESGVKFCILGTAAIKDPDLLARAAGDYPGRIILGLDARNGNLSIDGWKVESKQKVAPFLQEIALEGVAEIIYTDIARDGMLTGINIAAVEHVADVSPRPVIASGGLSSLDEIGKLKLIANVSGVIAGKALYEGRIDLKEAIKAAC